MIRGVLIYQSRSPNNPKQVQCNAVQNAVPTHDAMIASSGTGTAGPLMGTTHSPQVRSETKDKRNKSNAEQKINKGLMTVKENM